MVLVSPLVWLREEIENGEGEEDVDDCDFEDDDEPLLMLLVFFKLASSPPVDDNIEYLLLE